MMAVEVVMPQMGESVVEGTIITWLVKEGDEVSEDQPLVAISTDKVDTEIPSPAAGTMMRIVAKEGETLPIGALIAVIEPGGTHVAEPSTPLAEAAAEAEAKEPAPQPTAPAPVAKAAPVAIAPSSDGRGAVRPPAPAAAAPERSAGPGRYSPLVLKIAEEQGIDLSQVRGTGLGGRVTKRDVLAYLEAPKPAAPAPVAAAAPSAALSPRPAGAAPQPGERVALGAFRPPVYDPREGDIVEPFSRRRKIIAEHMVYSKTHAPHVGTVAEVDMSRVARFREAHKDAFRQREGFNLTILPMVVVATARALREFPRMNASVSGDALVVRKEINLGVAVDTEEGLLVPVIKGADQKSLLGIAREIDTLARKAAQRQIGADDLAGGSFTVTNPGREGNLFGMAIINQPQVGILRMGEIKKTPVVVEVDGNDAIAIRHIMYLALSYDHRVIDGVLGNRFLFRVARLLEEAEFTL
jgi:pyruvate/2-oxoglutarate dehydrogenase complex dihydrolipoamide acyltransferase (E2) component